MGDSGAETALIDSINKLDLNQLYNVRDALANAIANRATELHVNQNQLNNTGIDKSVDKDINDYIQYSPDKFVDELTHGLLVSELVSLNFNRRQRNDAVQNRFISTISGSYDWGSHNGTVTNIASAVSDFPTIKQVMDKINSKYGTELNSVLVSYYKNGNVNAGLHHDGEETMDPSQPICVYTIGAKRKIEFVNNGHRSYTSSLVLQPEDGSLYVMKVGTQEHFRHRVRKCRLVKDERISLSFRCFRPTETSASDSGSSANFVTPPQTAATPSANLPMTPVKHPRTASTPRSLCPANMGYYPYPGHKDDTLYSGQANIPTGNPKEKLCLLFGSSITVPVDGSKMSRGNRTVINLSSSGFRIGDIAKATTEFWEENQDCINRVDKVIINVGTNEIKGYNGFARKVNVFWGPLCKLVQTIRFCFPNAQIIFQSVLPIRSFYRYNAYTVNQFNLLLIKLCKMFGCYFFDCFSLFLDGDCIDINWDLYKFSWKGVRFNQGIHLSEKGIGVLCKALKFAVHHSMHSPYPVDLPFPRFYHI